MRRSHATALAGVALIALLAAACDDDSTDPDAAEGSASTSASESGSGGATPDAGTSTSASPTDDPTSATPQPATGPEVTRKHYTVRLPKGFKEMPTGTLGKEAVAGCADACLSYLAISDPRPIETDPVAFDVSVDSMVEASTMKTIRRLPDEEHAGRRTYHLAGTDGATSMHEFGFLEPDYELSIQLTMDAPTGKVERLARAVLASLTFR